MANLFPDQSAQEQIIRTVGGTELLYKAGVKILRVNRARWGTEEDAYKYRYLAPYLRGRVLHLGVGMGLSLDAILASAAVTECVAYEWARDVADLYAAEHAEDPRLTVEVLDAYEHKPGGDFDACLYELPMDSRVEFDKSKAYFQWVLESSRMNDGGHLILPADRFARALLTEFPLLNLSEIAVRDAARPSPRPLPIWIVVTK